MSGARATSFIDPSGANLEEVRRLAHQVVDIALRARSGPRSPVPAAVELPSRPFIPTHSRSEDSILEELRALIAGSIVPSHPGFVAHMGAVSSTMSPLGDFVATCLNNNLIGLELSPALSRLEDAVVRELAGYFGLGPEAGGVITTGGSLSNLHALVVARNAVLDTLEHGVQPRNGAPVLLVSEAAHASLTKGAMIAGLGARGALPVRAAESGRMDLDDLRSTYDAAIRAGSEPFAVVATAGTTVTGSIDPIAEVGAFARERGLWFHVDAAWGGGLRFSARLRGRLRGIELADSVTFCPQKLLLVGLSSSVVLFRDMAAMRSCFRTSFPYVEETSDFTNLCEIGIQGSRPAEILKLWLTLAHIGERKFAELIEGWVGLAEAVAEKTRARSFLRLACAPDSGIVCFRGTPGWIDDGQWDAWNRNLREALARRAGIHLSFVPYGGSRWLRAVFANPFTGASIVERMFALIDDYAARRPIVTESRSLSDHSPPETRDSRRGATES